MELSTSWESGVFDKGNLIPRLAELLRARHVDFCVIGDQAANAHTESGVSFELDLILEPEGFETVEQELEEQFIVQRASGFYSVNAPRSSLRVQIRTDSRYQAFVSRAVQRGVFGTMLPVAQLEDVLQDKLWSALDSSQSGPKRSKDMADIGRLLEVSPHLRSLVPATILSKLGYIDLAD